MDFLAGYIWALIIVALAVFIVHWRYRLVRRTSKHKKTLRRR